MRGRVTARKGRQEATGLDGVDRGGGEWELVLTRRTRDADAGREPRVLPLHYVPRLCNVARWQRGI
jgi:hypothetical protein